MSNKIQTLLLVLIIANLAFLNFNYLNQGSKTSNIENVSSLPAIGSNNNTDDSIAVEDQSTTTVENANNINAGSFEYYYDGNVKLNGYWVPSNCDQSIAKIPTVIIAPTWRGIAPNERDRAQMLSEECYNAFALDMFSLERPPQNREDAIQSTEYFKNNPELLQRRIQAAIDHVKAKPSVDPNNIALIGYSFGGWISLEYARSGSSDIKGVVTYYSDLDSVRKNNDPAAIKANIEIHRGDKNIYVSQEQVDRFKAEMKKTNVRWNIYNYPEAGNSFANTAAGYDVSIDGIAYNEKADKAAWQRTLDFLNRVLK